MESKTFGNGDQLHVGTGSSQSQKIRFTVVPDQQFVSAHDQESADLLTEAGCPIDGEPLNETTG